MNTNENICLPFFALTIDIVLVNNSLIASFRLYTEIVCTQLHTSLFFFFS